MAISPPVDAQPAGGDAITLAPRFWVPLGLTLLAALVLAGTPRWSGAPWLGLTMLAFASFLLVQTAVLRLCFDESVDLGGLVDLDAFVISVLRAGHEAVFLGAVEDGEQAVVVALKQRISFVVVTAGAAEREA